MWEEEEEEQEGGDGGAAAPPVPVRQPRRRAPGEPREQKSLLVQALSAAASRPFFTYMVTPALPCPALSRNAPRCPAPSDAADARLSAAAAERGGGGGGARARAGAQVLDTLLALALQKGVPRSGCILVPPRPAPCAPRAAVRALLPCRPRPAPSRPPPPPPAPRRRPPAPSTAGPADLPAGAGAGAPC